MLHKERELSGQVYKDHPEITRIGYYLRRYKIDEFPQLFNLLKGEMSIVGPRPCLPAIIENNDLENSIRFNVKPGLTSIAGVNGSIYLTWKEKWWYDEYYVENLSFLLDIKIIFRTIAVVIFGEEKFLNKPKMDHHGNS